MRCPSCSSQLEEKKVNNLILDICQSGCGGIWFDAGELEKIDDTSENVPKEILRPIKNQNVVIDRSKQRNCPKCSSSPLNNNAYNEQYHIEIDNCLTCGGIWLDLGEIETLRSHNTSQTERTSIINAFMEKVKSSDPVKKKRLAAVIQLLFK